jgi:hypothetical protein
MLKSTLWKMKIYYVLLVFLLLAVACNSTSKDESGLWSNQEVKLLKFSANNEYLVLASTKKNDSKIDSLSSYSTLTKLFVFKNICKSNSNNRGWSLVSEGNVFAAEGFESLYLIKSNQMALVLATTNLGGAHGMDDMHLYKIDTNGKLEYRREPYEEKGTEPDGSEHFAVNVVNDSTMTITRDQGIYQYSIVRNEINRTFISNVEKAETKGAIVAKYIYSNYKFSAYGQSTFNLKVGQAIIFDGADAKTNNAPMDGIFTDAWSGALAKCEADKLRDFTYTFNKPGEFHFLIADTIFVSTRNEQEIKPTFTVVVSPR